MTNQGAIQTNLWYHIDFFKQHAMSVKNNWENKTDQQLKIVQRPQVWPLIASSMPTDTVTLSSVICNLLSL